jgi:hypothetical protein
VRDKHAEEDPEPNRQCSRGQRSGEHRAQQGADDRTREPPKPELARLGGSEVGNDDRRDSGVDRELEPEPASERKRQRSRRGGAR